MTSDRAKKMEDMFKSMGITKNFKTYMVAEDAATYIKTRKPSKIVDGKLTGNEIVLEDKLFRVWTPKKKLANAYATKYGLKIRLLDGEAELWVTPETADELLPKFGAKVKREITDVERAALNARLAIINAEKA